MKFIFTITFLIGFLLLSIGNIKGIEFDPYMGFLVLTQLGMAILFSIEDKLDGK
jgi:hypothetical protein